MPLFTISGTIPSVDDFRTSTPKRITPLGTWVFDDITFPAGTYINQDGEAVDYPELVLLSVQVMIAAQKNIIETPVSGQNGSIKEYISTGDYQISVTGKITELLNVFPADELENYIEIANIDDAINIESKLLNEFFNVFNVVIKKFSYSSIPGSLNEFDINIELLSDYDLDLNNFLL